MVALTLISAVTAGLLTDFSFGFIGLWATLPGAVLIYLLMVSVDNIQTECFGFGFARRNTWICFLSEAFMILAFEMVLRLKHPVFADTAAFQTVMHSSIRAAIASPLGFAVSSFLNSYIINGLKVKMTKKYHSTNSHIWFRTWSSTVVSQAFDAFIFITITFAFTMPWNSLFMMFLGQYTFKLVVSFLWCLVETPVIKYVKEATGCDAVENDKAKLKRFAFNEN